MTFALCVLALGVIVGVPICLYGFMRIEEADRRRGLVILLIGIAMLVGPTVWATILHQQTSGTGRYDGP